MYGKFQDHLQAELQQIEDSGLTKNERQITSPQGARVSVNSGAPVLNLI